MADFAAYTCGAHSTGGGLVLTAILDHEACAGFEARVEGRLVSKGSLGFRGSGGFWSSADGRSVLFLHSFPYASEGTALDTIPGVILFRDGRKVASYTVADLIYRPRMVSWSTSHLLWLPGKAFPWVRHAGPIDEALGPTWTLYTSSYRRIEFDTVTGEILRAEDTEVWTACRGLAYGSVEPRGDALVMETGTTIKNPVSYPLAVRRPASFSEDQSVRVTVCLNAEGQPATVLRKQSP
jgi:hypothetical protein